MGKLLGRRQQTEIKSKSKSKIESKKLLGPVGPHPGSAVRGPALLASPAFPSAPRRATQRRLPRPL